MHVTRLSLAALLGVSFAMPVIGQDADVLLGPEINEACKECAVVYDIRAVTSERQLANTLEEHPLQGPYIKFPLSSDPAAQPEVGAYGSRKMRKQLERTVYEVIVRFDDDRFRLIEVNDISDLQIGDRVRVHQNRIEPVDAP
jgi:hypothetical protein